MKAKNNKTYAVIDNQEVTHIFTKEDLSEWNADDIFTVELTSEQKEWVRVGMKYDTITQTIIQPTLEEYKAQRLEYINRMFDFEINELTERIPNDERLSWSIQEAEAKDFKRNRNIENCTFLNILAQIRGDDFEELVNKVYEKNEAFNVKLAKLIGNRQVLQKQIENAQDYKAVLAVEYASLLGK